MSRIKEYVKISKFLSLVLRHRPSVVGLQLDDEGWVNVEALIKKSRTVNSNLTLELLIQVVAQNDKKRFSFNDNFTRIRANQGHSIKVDLGLQPITPPRVLYHGTALRFVESIKKKGLCPGNRQHVHLSLDEANAIVVGQRHGKPVVLRIDAEAMNQAGLLFYISQNGVWLTDFVPKEFIEFPLKTSQSFIPDFS